MRLLYFYERRPGPCMLQNLIVDNVEKGLKGKLDVQRLDAEANKDLMGKYGIREIPSIVMEKDGKEVTRFSGLTQETFLRRAIERNLT
jgi:thioredoxin 1